MGPLSQLMKLQERLSSNKGARRPFRPIEAVGEEPVARARSMQIYALRSSEIDGPTSKNFPRGTTSTCSP